MHIATSLFPDGENDRLSMPLITPCFKAITGYIVFRSHTCIVGLGPSWPVAAICLSKLTAIEIMSSVCWLKNF